ncbi:hypothetical protein CHELA40_12000 [Chelatococcus asaccharovorans]|nr:hypothetical protein CHELA40_12000 [Chelatococcus asaccharovorans]CAH1683645.1 hypothetical protein CHELA17_63603 [Chelatococcus asaccharovorans]
MLGATMAHFLIDAYTWRLSNPTSRNYVRQRFAFLFSKLPSSRGPERRRRETSAGWNGVISM